MGWITAQQPNGKYCILSTIVDQIIADNLTEEEFINEFVERATEKAKAETERQLRYIKHVDNGFDEIKGGFYPDSEQEVRNIRQWLKDVGDPNWEKYDYKLDYE